LEEGLSVADGSVEVTEVEVEFGEVGSGQNGGPVFGGCTQALRGGQGTDGASAVSESCEGAGALEVQRARGGCGEGVGGGVGLSMQRLRSGQGLKGGTPVRVGL